MMNFLVMGVFLFFFPFVCCDGTEVLDLKPMKYIDLNQYLGQWYEIALIPNKFQRKCLEGGIAEYSLLPSMEIEVTNCCITSKGQSEAKGVAWVVDKQSQAKLKVSFVPFTSVFHWFAGDYWILYVDEAYQIAIVGEPSFRYLWFLSRSPQIDDVTYQFLIEVAQNKGYDSSKIKRVR